MLSETSTEVPSALLARRPDILQAENVLKASRADVESAKAAFYPTLQLSGSLGLQSFRLAFLLDSPTSLAFNFANGLVMPILNRRALKAELMDAKGKQLEAYLNYEKTILNAMTEVYGLLQFKENLEQMQQIKTAEVSILQASVNTANALYLSGRSTYLEIITAQDYFLQRQLEALQVQLRNFNNQIQLYKAIGGGF
jgi:outer membrane protein TolC